MDNPTRFIDPDGMQPVTSGAVMLSQTGGQNVSNGGEESSLLDLSNMFAASDESVAKKALQKMIDDALSTLNEPSKVQTGGVVNTNPSSGSPDVAALAGAAPTTAPNILDVGSNGNAVNNQDPCTARYQSYDATQNVESYNCAGLAFRNYRFMGSLQEVEDVLNKNKMNGRGKQGDIKFWLWTYTSTAQSLDGQIQLGTGKDFHIVAGVLGPNGADPTNVFSKNGHRPVFGPAAPLSWKPLEQEPVKTNNQFNSPVFESGRQIYWIRTNIVQQVFILPCKTY
jgi:hypothetical protein